MVSGSDGIRVLLADDEPLVRGGLAMLIEAEPDLFVVGEADDGVHAVELANDLSPDVVVMDVRMPHMDGVQATRALLDTGTVGQTALTVTVLMLTTFNDDDAVYEALRAGASGFLLKNAAPRMLAEAIRSVAAGDAFLAPVVARRLLDEFAARPDPSLPTPEQMRQLTGREKEVLTLMAHGFANGAIAAHLVVSEATVKTHVSRVLMKLGLHDRAQAVVAAYKSGMVKPGDSPPPRR